MEPLKIADKVFTSRLFTGTGKFASNQIMEDAILASESQLVTVALKRVDMESKEDDIIAHLKAPHITLLPNTSGVRTAKEAVFAAQLAREALGTNWLKLEIHPDPKYLLPDPIETLKATEELAKLGFIVLPYIQADPVLCKHLENAGAATVMPLGAPIGTNKGLVTRDLGCGNRGTFTCCRCHGNGSLCRVGEHRYCRIPQPGRNGTSFQTGC